MAVILNVKYFILFQAKKNTFSAHLNVAQYAKVVESLTVKTDELARKLRMYEAENDELKQKLRKYEAENGCQKSTSTSVVPLNYKDKLYTPYQELEDMDREISKLVKEIKLLNWRNHVKEKIADRLPCLSINTLQLDKVI
jgi:predicted RNase H-like nuclease (RuvC/YqgF family)